MSTNTQVLPRLPRPIGVQAWAEMRNFGRIRERWTPSGESRWWVDFRTEVGNLGLPIKMGRIYSMPTLTGSRVFKVREDAEEALHYVRSEVAKGTPFFTVLESFRPTGTAHVDACADRWLVYREDQVKAGRLGGRTAKKTESVFRNHVIPKWKGVSIHDIRYGHLDDWATELQASGLDPTTAAGILSALRAMMRWLKRRQELSEIPEFPEIEAPERAPKILTLAQQTAVLEAIPVEKRGIFIAMADLWVRPGEARALRPAVYEVVTDRTDTDPAGWLTIKAAADGEAGTAPVREWTKTKKIRHLPVSDRLAGWIAEHVPRDARLTQEFLFPSPTGVMWSHGYLKWRWRKASEAADVPIVPVREGTRHSSATAARREQWPLDLIQRMLGHADVKNTERYSRHHQSALVQLVRREHGATRK